MKKVFYCVIAVTVCFLLLVSCKKEKEYFNETLLIGKWVSGTEFYKYESNGTGSTWDTSDDVSEEEAQAFEWTLVEDELTHIHLMEIGSAVVPKVYTVTKLTTGTLEYKDSFGKQFSYSKV